MFYQIGRHFGLCKIWNDKGAVYKFNFTQEGRTLQLWTSFGRGHFCPENIQLTEILLQFVLYPSTP